MFGGGEEVDLPERLLERLAQSVIAEQLATPLTDPY
jgi:hypothetical protein